VKILSPLRHRPIALLWSGQVLSSIGDEIYRVAVIWLSVTLIGKDAGFLASVMAACILVFGLFGGSLVEGRDHRKVMIAVDLLRAVVVLIPPAVHFFTPLTPAVLVVTAILLSSLTAFFEPALKASLPGLATTPALLSATNALLESNFRIARLVGAGTVGVLQSLIPMIHFFTVDSVTFLVSAFTLTLIPRTETPPVPSSGGVWPTLRRAWADLSRDPFIAFSNLGTSIVWSMWSLGFLLSTALLVKERWPDDVGSYGLILSAYGAGNLVANLIAGNYVFRNPPRVMFVGLLVLGFGFVALAASPSLPWMMVFAAISAVGGPLDDLAFLQVLQSRFKPDEISRVFRLRLALGNGGMLMVYLASPFLFRMFSVESVIAGSGIFMAAFAALGLIRFWNNRDYLPL
jgi:MFS family permease